MLFHLFSKTEAASRAGGWSKKILQITDKSKETADLKVKVTVIQKSS
jgi:hypothetical protein